MCGNVMVKKLLEIKLGFWDHVRKHNVKKLTEIKLGFWDNVRKYNGKKTFGDNAWVLGHARML